MGALRKERTRDYLVPRCLLSSLLWRLSVSRPLLPPMTRVVKTCSRLLPQRQSPHGVHPRVPQGRGNGPDSAPRRDRIDSILQFECYDEEVLQEVQVRVDGWIPQGEM